MDRRYDLIKESKMCFYVLYSESMANWSYIPRFARVVCDKKLECVKFHCQYENPSVTKT